MPNWATTDYVIVGDKEDVKKIADAAENAGKSGESSWAIDRWLGSFAENLGIDWDGLHLTVRGYFVSDITYKEDGDTAELRFCTESAWTGCDNLFEAVRVLFNGRVSISYFCEEPGCCVYYKHDEGNYFPADVYVECAGEPFDGQDGQYECITVKDAIDYWCECVEYDRKDETDDEMLQIIEGYVYEDEDAYYYINTVEEE